MRPKSLLRSTFLLLFVWTLLSATCDTANADEEGALIAFEQGYVYLNPDDGQIYVADASDLENPVALTATEGIREFNLSRNARQVVYIARPPQAVGDQLYVISAQGGAARILVSASVGTALAAPAFSPNGSQVAFGYSDGPASFNIGIININGSGLRRVNPDLGIFGSSAYFSPNFVNEQSLWMVGAENGNMLLTEMDAATGVETNRWTQVGLAPLAASSRLTLSPDGNHVAWSGQTSAGPRIFVWGPKTGTVRQLTAHSNAAAVDAMPFWKDRTTVLWTTREGGVSHAYSAQSNESKTAGNLEWENAVQTVYGPIR